MITISEEEFLKVVEGERTFSDLALRKLKETDDALKTSRQLNEELHKSLKFKDSEILKQLHEASRWKELYILAKSFLTKSGNTKLNIKLEKDYRMD